jgi:putative transposase
MGTSSLQQNTLIEIDGKSLRLVRKLNAQLWQVEEEKSKRIHEYTDDQLLSLYAEGNLIFINEVQSSRLTLGKNIRSEHREITEEQFEEAKNRLLYAKAVLDIPSSKIRMESIIKDVWERLGKTESPPHWVTVANWKSKYLKAGQDVNALVERQKDRGNKDRRYPPEVIEFVHAAIDTTFLTRERKTYQDVLEDAIYRVKKENLLRPESMPLPVPTRFLVTREIESIPAFDRHAARYGHTAAIKKFRAVRGHRTTEMPLARAEIDHTPLDLFVLDDASGLPLGRPYLTACIDDFSRCILGFHVGFEPPSYLTVAKCLLNAFLPKPTLRERYPSIQNMWSAYGVMRELVVDNGLEFHSASLENACLTLGIELHYAPRKTGWFKGKVERFLGTMNRGVAHGVPGTTFSNIFDKDDYDPSKLAVVRLSTLHEITHLWIADYYHQKVHRALGMPPAVMWESSIKREDILLPDDPSEFKAMLGRSETRSLTHKGIELDGLQYNSPELVDLRRQLGDVLKMEIRIDDADIGSIVVLSPDRTQRFSVKALKFDYADGLSRWQHRICKRFAARQLNKFDPLGWLEAKRKIAVLIEQESLLKKQKSRKRIARYNGERKAEPPKVETAMVETALEVNWGSSLPLPPSEPLIAHSESKTPTLGKTGASRKKFIPVHRERDPHILEEDQNGKT